MVLKEVASRALTDNAAHGVIRLGGSIEACNDAACLILGRPREALIGASLVDLSPSIQADGTLSSERWARRLHTARAGLPQWFQWQFQKSGDGAVHALVHLSAANGHGECVIAEVHDLSRISGAGWATPESGARLKNVLERTKAVIFVKDRESRYIFVNHEMERAVRRPAQEIIGRTDYELWRSELAERFRRNDMQVMEQRQAIEFEITDTYGGQQKTYHSFKFPLFDPRGVPYAVCGIASDISERKQIEDALRNAALAVSSAQGATVFQELMRYLATTLQVECALVAVPRDSAGNMRVLAFYLDGQIKENFEYPIAGTPCETVMGKVFRIYASGLKEAFPADSDFANENFESYAGYPLSDGDGGPLGLIAVVSRKQLSGAEFIESVLKIFAVRAEAELERMRSEEALRSSEASYRAIFEASEDAIFIHDWETGAIVDVNPKACEAFGYSYEEMKRTTVADVSSGVHPYTAEQAAKYLGQARAGNPVRFEWHRRNRDGSLHWDEVVLRKAVIAGKPRIVAFSREITERKHSEEALRASEEHYRAIFNASADGLLLRDAEFRVVDVNPAFLALTGYAREDVMGVRHVITMPKDDAAGARELQRRALGGEKLHVEGKGVRKDGSHYDCEVDLSPMQYKGEPHVLAIVRDISARRQAEARREQLEAQLRQAQKMEAIGQLTGGIAHDFNNLLTSIMGYVVLATEREAGHGDAKLSKYLEQAHLSCVRARDLIQQMLTFSRGQRGEPRPLSLPPFVKESIKLLRSSLPTTIEIETDLGRDIPAVLLDPVQLDQILLNLCINARDAMGGTGSIRVGTHPVHADELVCTSCRQNLSGNFVELSVSDNGPGIRPEVVDRMFEPFYTTKEVGKGSGMGLATVHGIVHEHGGHVIVETASGRGAKFRVLFLPLQADGADALAPSTARRRSAPPRQSLQGRVLVVDDEDAVAEFMRDLLESWGLDVTVLLNATEARNLFMRDPARFDLVITDQTMPRMTGMELAREMLGKRPDLPVILYSGFGEGISQDETAAAGIRALVKKPVEPQALFTLLKAYLRPPQ